MRRKLLSTYILSMFIIACIGQLYKIESKEDAFKKLKQNISDSNRQYIYNFLGTHYLNNSIYKINTDSAFYFLRKAVYLGDSSNFNNKQITNESLCLLAQTYSRSGNVSTSKQIFLQVIKNYHAHHQMNNEAKTWQRMGYQFWTLHLNLQDVPIYYDNAIALFEQDKKVLEKAEVMIYKIDFFVSVKNNSAVEKELNKIFVLAKENNYENLSHIYVMLAHQNRYNGNLNKGLEYALEAVKYIDYLKNKTGAHNFYGELAQIYEELGESEKSILWYKKCLWEREQMGISLYVIYRTTSLMIIQMIKAKREKEAIVLLQQLAKRKPPDNHVTKAILAQSFAYCYATMKQYKAAEPKFLEMIDEYDKSQPELEILYIAYYDISRFYVDFEQYEKAGIYLKKALEFSGLAISREKDLTLLMFKVDSANGNLAAAIKHFQKYKSLNDSIFNVAKSTQINELMIRYESEKKDNNIKFLQNKNVLQDGQLIQANQTRNWMLGFAILLVIITGLLIHSSRIKQRTNKKLLGQQKEIQSQNISLQHLLQEKEWLVKEIHHRVKNNFHIVMGLLGTQSGYLKNEEAIAAIAESQQRIQTMSLIHQKLYQSDNMSNINMDDYIHELVDYLKEALNTGRRIQFHFQLDRISLGVYHSVPIGLILNETITNAIKYAFPNNRTGNIYISFTANNGNGNNLLLVVKDDGVGLPADFDHSGNGTMGLNLMKGLAKDIDGHFTICSTIGTAVTIAFVYHPESPKDYTTVLKETKEVI